MSANEPNHIDHKEEDQQRSQLKKVINLGKEQGYLTYAQIYDSFPNIVDTEHFDVIIDVLKDMSIKVFKNQPSEEEIVLLSGTVEEGPEDVEEAASMLASVDKELGRTTDPVRMYMREMGTVELLTRDGEVEISRRIEDGVYEILVTLGRHSQIIDILLSRYEKSKIGEIRLAEVIRGFNDDLTEVTATTVGSLLSKKEAVDDREDESESEEPEMVGPDPVVVKAHFDRLKKQNQKVVKAQAKHGTDHKKTQAQIDKMVEEFLKLKLASRQIDKLMEQMRSSLSQIRNQERIIRKACIEKLKIPRNTFIKSFLGQETNLDWIKTITGKKSKIQLTDKKKSDEAVNIDPEIVQQIVRAQKKLINIEEISHFGLSEIKDINRRISIGESKARRAKKEMVEANLRLVISIAKKYTNRGLQFLDLIQEGNIGLMKAVDKFEYRRGYKFSTYATWWIRQAITRSIADQARTIRIPVHMIETINKLNRISRQILQETGKEPTPELLAEKMEIPEDKIRKVLKIAKEPISMETPVGDDEESHLGDFLEDVNILSPLDSATDEGLKEATLEILKTLTPREAKVLCMRFGIDMNTDHTLEEVGKQFDVTRERIRQIEAKALRKLRHPSRSDKLRSFIDTKEE